MEHWKDIPEWQGYYQASNKGRIRSLDRVVNSTHNSKRTIIGSLIKTRLDSNKRYMIVDLHLNRIKKTILVHRLIAHTFLGMIEGYEINHKDGNTKNNCISNLQICTHSENEIHKYRILKRQHPFKGKNGKLNVRSLPIIQIDIETGVIIHKYESGRMAERDGFSSSCISKCCRGLQKKHKHFYWKFYVK